MSGIEERKWSRRDRGGRGAEPRVRRSSSLGRLGDVRLPSLSFVEIDIDGSSTGPDHKGTGDCTQTSNGTGLVDSTRGLRRSSSFRRRPSVPLMEIVSDFGRNSPPMASSEVKSMSDLQSNDVIVGSSKPSRIIGIASDSTTDTNDKRNPHNSKRKPSEITKSKSSGNLCDRIDAIFAGSPSQLDSMPRNSPLSGTTSELVSSEKIQEPVVNQHSVMGKRTFGLDHDVTSKSRNIVERELYAPKCKNNVGIPTLADRKKSLFQHQNSERQSTISKHETSKKSSFSQNDFNRKRFSSQEDLIPPSPSHDFGRIISPIQHFNVNRSSNEVGRKSQVSHDNDVGKTSPLPLANEFPGFSTSSPMLFVDSELESRTFISSHENLVNSRRGSYSSEGISEFLAAAIDQMDDIIANNSFDQSFDDDRSSTSSLSGVGGASRLISHALDRVSRVTCLVTELRHILESTEDPDDLKTSVPRDSLLVLRDWLIPDVDEMFSMVNVRSQYSEETIRRLEEDRHSLGLQVSVLTDQVEAQADKIREMEMLMDEDKRRIMDANEILQQELLSRSHLESHKLELMSEVSGLKLRLSSAEKDRRELDDRFRAAQRQAAELEAKLVMKDAENSELRMRLGRNGTLPPDSENTEVEKLKRAVDTLMLANEDKERKLEDLRRLLRRYRRVEEILIQAQGRKAVEELLSNLEDGDTSSNSSSTTPSVGDPNLRDPHNANNNNLPGDDRVDGRHYISSPSATSTPVHQSNENSRLNASFHGTSNGSSPPLLSMGTNSRQAMGLARSNSCENLVPGASKTSSGGKGDNHNGGQGRGGGLISPGYGTLPKHSHHNQHHLPNHHHRSKEEDLREGPVKRGLSRGPFLGLGRTLMRVRSGKRSCSAPNLAHSEVVTDDEDGLQHYGQGHGEYKKRRGLRRLFGRLKRSSSQDLEGSRDRHGDTGEFRRGGVRATATARLAWNRDVKGRISNPDIPFARWDTDRITAWLNDIGLNMYLVDCKRWVRNGEQLMRCSQHDLEKEMGMKNSLHRKKLTLAMKAISSSQRDLLEELDHNFVARWLDDIGLPQYKDSFYDARVDARTLNSLTVEDLFNLKVSNEVHHVSIKRGIQILRLNNFNPNALRRRPASDEHKKMEAMPGEVVLWTNHRVMEWLRTIDLSEYAPNLRGSGVHGALMVLEPRFNAELFAILLSIPPSKTLLRRHLNSHFIGLIGPETQQRKREQESQPGFAPLLHNNKIKVYMKGKFGLFGHKRSRSEPEMESLICPPDLNGYQHNNGNVPNEKAVKEIGAYSQEINSLTTMLSHERFMDSAKTSNV